MLKLLIWTVLFNASAPMADVITLSEDMVLTTPMVITQDTEIIGNNHYIDATQVDYVFDVKENVTLTITNVQFKGLTRFAKSRGRIDMTNEKGKWRFHHSDTK